MTVGIASRGHIGLRKEYSFASGGAVTDYQKVISATFTPKKNFAFNGYVMESAQQFGGNIMQNAFSASLTFLITPSNTPLWWECGIGGTTSPYTPARPLSSLAMEGDFDKGDIYSSGDMINSLEFSSQAGQSLQCAVNIEGKGYQAYTASAMTNTSGDTGFLHNELTFEINDTAMTDIMSWSLSVNNNLETGLWGTDKERIDIPAKKCVVTGSITKLFQDTNERNLFLTENPAKLEFTFARGSNSFKIQCDKVRFNSYEIPLSGQNDYVTETFEFTSYIDNLSTENTITITVV